MNKKKRDGFIMQAGILAAAGIIVRIIGILYRKPLLAIIGDEGNGYYSTAYAIYTIILLVSSYSIPSAISKVIAARLAKKEYKNAQRIFQCAFIYVIVVGGIGSLACFFGADYIVGQHSAMVLRVFAPTIFLSGLLGVLRGYFQANRTMLQTSISQILEQVLNAIVSVLGAYLLMGVVANQDETTQAIYGAIGSALGTGSGVLIALIFMWLIYMLNRRDIKRRVDRDTFHKELTYGQIFQLIIGMVTPIILSTFIYNLNTVSNLKIYQEIMQRVFLYTETQATTAYGLYSGKAMQIINIPIAIASSMSAAIIPTIASTYEVKAKKETRKKIAKAIKVTMLISIPAGVGLFVFARPIVMILYPQMATVGMVSALIKVMAVTVVFYGLSTLTNAVLQGTGKVNKPVIHAALALGIQAVVLVPLLLFTKLDLYALGISTIVYSCLMCIFNQASIRKHLKYKQEMLKTFVLPFIAAFWMGIVAGVIYYGVEAIYRNLVEKGMITIGVNYVLNETYILGGVYNLVVIAIAMMVAMFVYFALIIKLGAVGKKELLSMPKGAMLTRIARKMHLIK